MEKKEEIQQESKSIGKILREKRENLGLSQEEIAERLKLRIGFVDAIEKEEWDKLPHPTFVKGFIRSYARLLGIEEKIEDSYKDIFSDKEEIPKKKKKGLRKIWFFGIIIFSLIFIAVFCVILKKAYKKENLKKKKISSGRIEKAATIYFDQPVRFPAILKLRTRKRTWLKIAVDSYRPETYNLEAGEYICWQIKEGFDLLVGDASGVEIWLNNVPITFPQKEEHALYLRVNKKNLKKVSRI